ncbi:MAG: LysM peptidoglycan-binding domain-containing protein [Polyangiaceae bacterium]
MGEVAVSARVEHTWIEVEIVDDTSGDPVPNAKVALTAPGTERRELTTTSAGIVAVKPCEHGTAILAANPGGASIGDTLEVLGAGEASMTPLRGQPFPRTPGRPWSLARIVRHRVRTGESLDSVAKAHGMTWQELAKFNFGTDDPRKINEALRDQVGCTRRTKSDKNYVLDSADEPGILFIPQPAIVTGLATGEQHVVRARAIDRPMLFFLFSH